LLRYISREFAAIDARLKNFAEKTRANEIDEEGEEESFKESTDKTVRNGEGWRWSEDGN
jgi:hypothetical protein